MTPEQASLIEQAEKLLADASPRPWIVDRSTCPWNVDDRNGQVVALVCRRSGRAPDVIRDGNTAFIEASPCLVAALSAELKRALEENAKLRDRLAKCEPVIELVRTFQTLNRQAIADGHTEWTEAEYDAMDMIAASTLPKVTP